MPKFIKSFGSLVTRDEANYIVPPTLTTTERNALTSVITGAMIYNSTTQTYERYTGTVWVPVQDSAVGSGNILYVSPNATNAAGTAIASDSWTRAQALGRVDRPFVTIQAAWNAAASGDAIFIVSNLTGALSDNSSKDYCIYIYPNVTWSNASDVINVTGSSPRTRVFASADSSSKITSTSGSCFVHGNNIGTSIFSNVELRSNATWAINISEIFNPHTLIFNNVNIRGVAGIRSGTAGSAVTWKGLDINVSGQGIEATSAFLTLENCKVVSGSTAIAVLGGNGAAKGLRLKKCYVSGAASISIAAVFSDINSLLLDLREVDIVGNIALNADSQFTTRGIYGQLIDVVLQGSLTNVGTTVATNLSMFNVLITGTAPFGTKNNVRENVVLY